MTLSKFIVIYSDNQRKQINVLCARNVEFLTLKQAEFHSIGHQNGDYD